MKEIKILELFSGYGGASYALRKANIPHKVIGYSDIEDCANYIYALNHGKDIPQLNDITKVNPNDLEDFDLLTGGFPCVLEDTLITTQRGQIPIIDVKVGDIVLTHKNRWRKVLKTMKQKSNHYYNVKIQGSPEIKITSEHPFYASKMVRIWNKGKRNNERHFSNSCWIETKNLRSDDFLAFGTWSDKYTTNKKKLTTVDCWLIGRYVADGYIQNNFRKGRKNSYNHKVIFCVGKDKKEEFLEKTKNSIYHIGVTEERTVYKYRIMNEHFMNLCLECGKGAINKKIPHWIINLPKNKLKHFLEGYMSGDGYFNKKTETYSATSISRILIYQLGQIIHRLYKTPYSITFYKRPKTTIIEGRIVNQNDTWLIRFKKKINKQDNGVWLNNNLYGRFISKKIKKGKFIVYNLEVEEDNSYVANNIIIHNCQSFSIAGKRDGFKAKRKGQLFFEIIRIAEHKRPRYMLLENVQGLLSHDNGKTMQVILQELRNINYIVKWKLMWSKENGTPQNRPRVWFACFREKEDADKFMFPEKEPLKITVKDLLEDEVDSKYYLNENQIKRVMKVDNFPNNKITRTITAQDNKKLSKRMNVVEDNSFKVADYIYDEGLRPRKDGVSPTLCSTQKSGQGISSCPIIYDVYNKSIVKKGISVTLGINCGSTTGISGQIINTITTGYGRQGSSKEFLAINKQINEVTNKWRRLTPRECFRLQGFFEDQITFGNLSDSKLYFLAGNGWDINVASKIFIQMFKGNQNTQKTLFE